MHCWKRKTISVREQSRTAVQDDKIVARRGQTTLVIRKWVRFLKYINSRVISVAEYAANCAKEDEKRSKLFYRLKRFVTIPPFQYTESQSLRSQTASANTSSQGCTVPLVVTLVQTPAAVTPI